MWHKITNLQNKRKQNQTQINKQIKNVNNYVLNKTPYQRVSIWFRKVTEIERYIKISNTHK